LCVTECVTESETVHHKKGVLMLMLERHGQWSTSWEMFFIDKLIDGLPPEQQIAILGLYPMVLFERDDVDYCVISLYLAELTEQALFRLQSSVPVKN